MSAGSTSGPKPRGRGISRYRVSDTDRAIAEAALVEMAAHRLCVALTPASPKSFPGHMVRVVESQNPDWLGRLNARRRRRKHDSPAKRSRVVRALERVASGWAERRGYDHELLELL